MRNKTVRLYTLKRTSYFYIADLSFIKYILLWLYRSRYSVNNIQLAINQHFEKPTTDICEMT